MLEVGDAVAAPISPSLSIIAGCFTGVDLARSLLYAILQHQHDSYRPRILDEQVDDLVLGDAGWIKSKVVRRMTTMVKDFVQQATALGLVFAPGKNKIVAGSVVVAKEIEAGLRKAGITHFVAAKHVRDVGVGFGGGVTRSMAVMKERLT